MAESGIVVRCMVSESSVGLTVGLSRVMWDQGSEWPGRFLAGGPRVALVRVGGVMLSRPLMWAVETAMCMVGGEVRM